MTVDSMAYFRVANKVCGIHCQSAAQSNTSYHTYRALKVLRNTTMYPSYVVSIKSSKFIMSCVYILFLPCNHGNVL